MPIVSGIARRLGQWQEIAIHYSAVFPPGKDPDPALVAEVRSLMPEFVPLHLRKVYATHEGGEEYLDFVVAGRWARTADDPEKEPLRLARPDDFPFKGGVIYEQRPLGTQSLRGMSPPKEWAERGVEDLPLKFDRGLVDWLKAAYRQFMNQTAKENKRAAIQARKAEEAARDKELADLQAQAKERFVSEIVSPGTATDAAWAAVKGPNVSVSVGA